MQSRNKPARVLGSCRSLCCNCRLSFSPSSSAEPESERYPAISSLAHAMVQERLDQMIKETQAIRRQRSRRSHHDHRREGSKFVVMMAMEKSSYDPRQDFKVSIEQMITANRIHEPRDLRRLLNYYVSMNSDEHQGVILEAFYEVCTDLFLSCKPNMNRRHNYSICS